MKQQARGKRPILVGGPKPGQSASKKSIAPVIPAEPYEPDARAHGKRYTDDEIAVALQSVGGFVSLAAARLGCNITTIYRRFKVNPALQEYAEVERESLVDLAEIMLKSKVQQGNMTAIIFTLKTLGRKRGYIERHEITGEDGKPIEIVSMSAILQMAGGPLEGFE